MSVEDWSLEKEAISLGITVGMLKRLKKQE
jgi:hypothetical protein